MNCAEGKITNPKTGRCINIGGSVFKILIHDPTVVFTTEDKKKIKNAGYMLVVKEPKTAKLNSVNMEHIEKLPSKKENKAVKEPKTPKTQKIASVDMKHIETLPSKTENKVAKHLARVDRIKQIQYLDDGHKQHCLEGKNNLLKIPLLTQIVWYKIPYSVCPIRNLGNFHNYLGLDKLPFVPGFQTPIKLTFNNYNEEIALQLFRNQDFKIDHVWFKDIDDYITNLSTYDAFTVLGYSYHSFEYINSFLIGTMTKTNFFNLLNSHQGTTNYKTYYFPFYMQAFKLMETFAGKNVKVTYLSQTKLLSEWIQELKHMGLEKAYSVFVSIMLYFPYEFWVEVMKLFKTDFERIINNAPPVRKETVVYRGVKGDYFLKGSNNNYYTNTSFVSCTLNPYYAVEYLRKGQCCLKRITLLPGTKVLFISGLSCYPYELEIVINVDSILFIKETITTNIYENNDDAKDDMCFERKRKIDISEIVIV